MKKIISLTLVLAFISLCGCGAGNVPLGGNPESQSEVSAQITTDYSVPEGTLPENLNLTDTTGMGFELTDRDKENSFENAETLNTDENTDTILITKAGTYILSGEITDKIIKIAVGNQNKVQLVLDNAHISNSKGTCIMVSSADKVFITAKEGTENSISDGESYNISDSGSNVDGAIFSQSNLTINGSGKITLNGNNKHGIDCKDKLVLANVDLTVNSKKVGLNGKDCVKISNANMNITAGSDGIRSENDQDAQKGFVYIQSGNISINAQNDGIQAETVVKIDEATLNIISGGGNSNKNSDTSASYKGIKANGDIIISKGSFNIDSADDSLHSNNSVIITGGDFNIASGDDAVHAEMDIAVSSGSLKVTKSYEAVEAMRIFITGGYVNVTASDDGFNAAGGSDEEQNDWGGGRPGMDNGIGEIVISGGYTFVDAEGDGLDSNGNITLSDGIVLVSGPVNGGNGALDYGRSANVTNGILIALGSSGMATGFTSAENQGALLYNFETQQGGTAFSVCNTDGTAIVSFAPKKQYSSAVVTAPSLVLNGTYTLVLGGSIENTDENGFAQNQTLNGGTALQEITFDTLVKNSGGGFGGGGNKHDGQRPGGGQRPDHGQRPDMSFPEDFSGELPPDMSIPDDFSGEVPPDMSIPEDSSLPQPEMSGAASPV